jgi:hypothetical protein
MKASREVDTIFWTRVSANRRLNAGTPPTTGEIPFWGSKFLGFQV